VAELAFLRRVANDGAARVGSDAALAGALAKAGMIRTLPADEVDAYAVLSGAGIRRLRRRA
jgi:hypothetical protein